jgi:hypothetical protein
MFRFRLSFTVASDGSLASHGSLKAGLIFIETSESSKTRGSSSDSQGKKTDRPVLIIVSVCNTLKAG